MKKFILAFFALIYLSTTIGVTVNMHYCMGKLTSLAFSSKNSDKCDKCGMAKSSSKSKDEGCCKDEQKFVQNTTDQKSFDAGIELAQLFSVSLPVTFGDIPLFQISSVTEENPISHAPPRASTVTLFVRNCSFLI